MSTAQSFGAKVLIAAAVFLAGLAVSTDDAQAQVAVAVGGQCDLVVKAPATSAHRDLGPHDPPIRACLQGWYCFPFDWYPARIAREASAAWAKANDPNIKGLQKYEELYIIQNALGKELLDKNNNRRDPIEYWGAVTGGIDDGSGPPLPVLDPPMGESVSHTWEKCYTKDELEVMMREAERWARYMNSIYLPPILGSDRSKWHELVGLPPK